MRKLLADVLYARQQFIQSTSGLTQIQAEFKQSSDEWCIIENVEHMVWAELGGINGMWKAGDAFRNHNPVFTGEPIHQGMTIEQIIEMTWKEKEQVPETARPRWGGPLSYWTKALENCHPLLESMINSLAGLDPDKIIHPHPISGPLNIPQRLEFLRFHLDRHRGQIERIKSSSGFLQVRGKITNA
jgi:hypothetical protein